MSAVSEPPRTYAQELPCTETFGGGRSVGHSSLCEASNYGFCDAIALGRLGEVTAVTTIVHCEPGEAFCHEGEPPEYLFNVVAGSVKLSKALSNGRCQIVGFLDIGDFIGLGPASATACSAQALTTLRLCRFERRRFATLLDAHPGLASWLLAAISNEVAAAQEHMTLLGRLTATERLARFLLLRSAAARRIGRPECVLDLPMTRSDVADYLGLTVETVSRILTTLRRREVIAYENPRSVTLRDLPALRRLAEGH